MQLKNSIHIASLSKSRRVAKEINSNMIYLLYGQVGAGKSTFVKNYLSSLGIEYSGSPTFNLVNEYDREAKSNKSKIIHIDFYRVNTKDAINIINEYIIDLDLATIFIEWPFKSIMEHIPIEKTITLCFVNRCKSSFPKVK